MSLERLVEEIRSRGEAELKAIEERRVAEATSISEETGRHEREIAAHEAQLAEVEAQRERVGRVAAAKLRARRKIFEAREARLERGMEETRELLAAYTRSPKYRDVLERMYRVAQVELGEGIVVRGRSEDASALRRIAGRSFQTKAEAIVGGLIAESPDGRRRLNLSFDELLRLREDRVRSLLS